MTSSEIEGKEGVFFLLSPWLVAYVFEYLIPMLNKQVNVKVKAGIKCK